MFGNSAQPPAYGVTLLMWVKYSLKRQINFPNSPKLCESHHLPYYCFPLWPWGGGVCSMRSVGKMSHVECLWGSDNSWRRLKCELSTNVSAPSCNQLMGEWIVKPWSIPNGSPTNLSWGSDEFSTWHATLEVLWAFANSLRQDAFERQMFCSGWSGSDSTL